MDNTVHTALVLADIHYVGRAKHTCPISKRKATEGVSLIRRVLSEAAVEEPSLAILLGDLVDNGNANESQQDLWAIKETFDHLDIPVLAVCGNHDGDLALFSEVFPNQVVDLAGYQFVAFSDTYRQDHGQRDFSVMKQIFSRLDRSRPIVACQHNPVYPWIDNEYPYNLDNSQTVSAYYRDNQVRLSLSGHVHWGVKSTGHQGVEYITLAALCESPHTYGLLKLSRNSYEFNACTLEPANSERHG